jgi:hypothetical protein
MKTTRADFKVEHAGRFPKALDALKAKVPGKPTHYQLILSDDDIIGISAMNGPVEIGFIAVTDSSAGHAGSGWHSSREHGSMTFRVDLQ